MGHTRGVGRRHAWPWGSTIWVVLILVLVVVDVRAECERSDCSASGTLEIGEAKYDNVKEISGVLGAKLTIKTDIKRCVTNSGDHASTCRLSVFLLSSSELVEFDNTIKLNKDPSSLDFLSKGSNYFSDIKKTKTMTTYYQQYNPSSVYIIFWGQKQDSPNQVTLTVEYKAEYVYETCLTAIGFTYGIYLVLLLIIAGSVSAFTIARDRKEKKNAENAMDQTQEETRISGARIEKDRALIRKKSEASWVNRPAYTVLEQKCGGCCAACTKPSSTFFPIFFLSRHDWFALLKRDPREQMHRGSLLLIALTKLTLAVFILTCWSYPIENFATATVESVTYRGYKELAVEIISKALFVWILIYLFGTAFRKDLLAVRLVRLLLQFLYPRYSLHAVCTVHPEVRQNTGHHVNRRYYV
eukprot:TRINITY_DN3336_c0_g1_i2.p1 TRINITY_DN3336_c0_g1~~TRINITY_DN3336_c0_g1_i2.p1  ORF type:complete len:413 (+),score=30.87 TRINITY_DN3336_c0_g1_i2:18-1256(+)